MVFGSGVWNPYSAVATAYPNTAVYWPADPPPFLYLEAAMLWLASCLPAWPKRVHQYFGRRGIGQPGKSFHCWHLVRPLPTHT